MSAERRFFSASGSSACAQITSLAGGAGRIFQLGMTFPAPLRSPSSGRLPPCSHHEQKLTREVMQKYLERKNDLDSTLIVLHARVAQKSYGTEKR